MIVFLVAVIVLLISLYFKYQLSFWKRHEVEGPAPIPIFGNLIDYILTKKKHFMHIYQEIYEWVLNLL